MQIKNFTVLIPQGVAFAASGLVGNCIGMQQINRAKHYSNASINYSMLLTGLLLAVFWVYDDELAFVFTDDQKIVDVTKNCMWSLFIYIFFSTVKGV